MQTILRLETKSALQGRVFGTLEIGMYTLGILAFFYAKSIRQYE
ncbi:hypothetical protein [Paenibacillus sedimenti]|nr:hypothetical protein [Paenibacillus sedimenti]